MSKVPQKSIVCPKCKKTIEIEDDNLLMKILKLFFKLLDKDITIPIWFLILFIIIIFIASGLI